MQAKTLLTAAALAASLARAETPRNVILIGWDGCQRAHLNEMIQRKELPNLVALSGDGARVDITVTSGATDTKAGWSQILTGYTPEISGVYSNGRYQPIQPGYTWLERLEKALGPDKVYTAMIVGKSGHVDAGAPVKAPYDRWMRNHSKGRFAGLAPGAKLRLATARAVTENGRQYVVIPGKPYYLTQNGIDLFKNGLGENRRVAEAAMKAIEEHKDGRFALFVHFARPDHDGHPYGENSRQYTAGVAEDDAWTGRIVSRLKELGLYDKTLVVVTADHGFDEGAKTHKNAPYVFLATNDKQVSRAGARVDVAPTILSRMGVDLASIDPPLSGKPL